MEKYVVGRILEIRAESSGTAGGTQTILTIETKCIMYTEFLN